MIILIYLLSIFHSIHANIETLHFESACLQQSNVVHLHLRCSQYEHIQIIRVIYGYAKQPSLQNCQFSIYDCIQEGASENILSCNNKQTCLINLTKNQMLSSSITTSTVPNCPDFNYIQVNFGCIPDTKDVCDSWKDEGATIHLTHTYSKDRQYNRCHCKIRSSLPNGQVLLQAREINQQYGNLKSLLYPKLTNMDCKKTTYLEITTSRFERKCIDMLPANNIALFGSGSHNFTLTYVKNDLFAELFFYAELKASPMTKDHNVQIICNWGRHQTTTTTTVLTTTQVISTTIPITRKRKMTTISMQRGGKLSRLDLIRHRPLIENTQDVEETTTTVAEDGFEEEEQEEEEEEVTLTTTVVIKTKKAKSKKTSTSTFKTTVTSSPDDDEEWSRIISLADIESPSQSKQLLSINNRTFVTAAQPSIINSDQKIHHSSSTSNTLLIILLVIICLTFLILLIYCVKIKQPDCIHRLKVNSNVAFLFCCEAGKLLFCSPNNARHQSQTTSNTPTSTIGNRRRHRRRHNRPSPPMPDYQSSEYYMDETGNNCRTTQSIYDGGGGKSIYSIDYDETEYTTKYDRHHDGGSC
jgi:hypothetical protein